MEAVELEPLFHHGAESALPHIFNPSVSLPAALVGSASITDCANSPGPFVTFDGSITTGGLAVNLIFRNNLKGTHERVEESVVSVSVISPDDPIVLPKQPVQGGVGGNPFIWVQLIDSDGEPISEEIFLGRCVQGPFNVDQGFDTDLSSFADFAITSCENSPGPFITVNGDATFNEGIGVRWIFRNNDNPVGGPHEATVTRDVTVVAAGESITFPKQPVEGGVGGNPWIFAAFADSDGNTIGEEELLGRCVQLNKALSS